MAAHRSRRYTEALSSAEDILSAALDLPAREQARLAQALLRSIDEATDEDAAKAWTDELRRRLVQVQDGAVELLSLDEVKRRIAERRASRRSAR